MLFFLQTSKESMENSLYIKKKRVDPLEKKQIQKLHNSIVSLEKPKKIHMERQDKKTCNSTTAAIQYKSFFPGLSQDKQLRYAIAIDGLNHYSTPKQDLRSEAFKKKNNIKDADNVCLQHSTRFLPKGKENKPSAQRHQEGKRLLHTSTSLSPVKDRAGLTP